MTVVQQEDLIQFNGMTFSIVNREVKFIDFCEKVTTGLVESKNNIMNYLDQCKGDQKHKTKDGLIMVADD